MSAEWLSASSACKRLFSCHRMMAAETIGQAITPSSRSSLRAHSMSSRRSKSCRLLQILAAANKPYAGVRTLYRQQPTNNTPELALQIGSRQQKLLQHWPLVFRFAAFAASLDSMLPLIFRFAASLLSLHSQRLLLIVISQQSAAILILFVGRRYYLRSIGRLGCLAQLLRCRWPR